jgi:HSP20 family protein
MFGYFPEFERTFAAMDELRRRMEHAFEDADERTFVSDTGWPRASLYDDGKALVLTADVPGLADKDIQLTLTQDVLSLKGERKLQVPEGYAVHRQERRPITFSRSFALPCKVDGEALVAKLKDGLLTVTMPKAPEAQPRRIAVKGA